VPHYFKWLCMCSLAFWIRFIGQRLLHHGWFCLRSEPLRI